MILHFLTEVSISFYQVFSTFNLLYSLGEVFLSDSYLSSYYFHFQISLSLVFFNGSISTFISNDVLLISLYCFCFHEFLQETISFLRNFVIFIEVILRSLCCVSAMLQFSGSNMAGFLRSSGEMLS